MLILGLGSNQGDRLAYLRKARANLSQSGIHILQVSPVYASEALLPQEAPAHWNQPYLNVALRCATDLSPFAVLDKIKAIERRLGRGTHATWEPRVIDIDLLAWDDVVLSTPTLTLPHPGLLTRPFALWPLADVAPFWCYPQEGPYAHQTAAALVMPWGSRFGQQAPFNTRQLAQRIDTPELVGIINLTPDSFSDGGRLLHDAERTQQAIEQLVNDGATIIDLGAEATNPRVTPISAELEWQRLYPVLSELSAHRKHYCLPPKISIDTRNPDVAEKALQLGVDWINDVSGLDDAMMQRLLVDAKCDVVFMHHLGIPANPQKTLAVDSDPVAAVMQWADERLQQLTQQGIAAERLIFDPGIGFGKTAAQSMALLHAAASFATLGVRCLIGHSRKSFLSLFTASEPLNRDIETAVLSLYLAKAKVDYLRVHNVKATSQAFKLAAAMEHPVMPAKAGIQALNL